jgi:hypothetical protein
MTPAPDARGDSWPEPYPGALAAGFRIVVLREELRQAERWVAEIDAHCASAHVALDRLRLRPELLERDPDALDHYEDGLAEALEARQQAAEQRDRLRAELHEAKRCDLLGLPPVDADNACLGGED